MIPQDTGLIDGKLISATGEIIFDPEHSRFEICTPSCSYFSGAPKECIALSDQISVIVNNERISLALLPTGDDQLVKAQEYVLTAMSSTGMDETTYNPGPEMMGFPLTSVVFRGKLYVDTLEGEIHVKARDAVLQALSPTGEVITEIAGEKSKEGICFKMTGEIPSVQFCLRIK